MLAVGLRAAKRYNARRLTATASRSSLSALSSSSHHEANRRRKFVGVLNTHELGHEQVFSSRKAYAPWPPRDVGDTIGRPAEMARHVD